MPFAEMRVALVVATLSLAGCSVTLRVVPSATLDSEGRVGVQALAGFGFMLRGDNRRGGQLGVVGGVTRSAGEPHSGGVIEDTIDYYRLPAANQPGLVVRAGIRLGLRPSAFPDDDFTLQTGGAVAVAWRLGAKLWHFIGVEARADVLGPFSDNGAPTSGLFAIGPVYEVAIPLLETLSVR